MGNVQKASSNTENYVCVQYSTSNINLNFTKNFFASDLKQALQNIIENDLIKLNLNIKKFSHYHDIFDFFGGRYSELFEIDEETNTWKSLFFHISTGVECRHSLPIMSNDHDNFIKKLKNCEEQNSFHEIVTCAKNHYHADTLIKLINELSLFCFNKNDTKRIVIENGGFVEYTYSFCLYSYNNKINTNFLLFLLYFAEYLIARYENEISFLTNMKKKIENNEYYRKWQEIYVTEITKNNNEIENAKIFCGRANLFFNICKNSLTEI